MLNIANSNCSPVLKRSRKKSRKSSSSKGRVEGAAGAPWESAWGCPTEQSPAASLPAAPCPQPRPPHSSPQPAPLPVPAPHLPLPQPHDSGVLGTPVLIFCIMRNICPFTQEKKMGGDISTNEHFVVPSASLRDHGKNGQSPQALTFAFLTVKEIWIVKQIWWR